jgi:hypothetical protein
MGGRAGQRMGHWMANQLFQILPCVFGAKALAVVFAVRMTLEARKCG